MKGLKGEELLKEIKLAEERLGRMRGELNNWTPPSGQSCFALRGSDSNSNAQITPEGAGGETEVPGAPVGPSRSRSMRPRPQPEDTPRGPRFGNAGVHLNASDLTAEFTI